MHQPGQHFPAYWVPAVAWGPTPWCPASRSRPPPRGPATHLTGETHGETGQLQGLVFLNVFLIWNWWNMLFWRFHELKGIHWKQHQIWITYWDLTVTDERFWRFAHLPGKIGDSTINFFLDIHQQKHTGTFRHVSPPWNIWRIVKQFAVKVGSIVIGHTIPPINCQIGWKQKPGQRN